MPLLLAAARTRSARAAAREVGVSTATASRQLDRMEEALGARLFDRTPTGLLPTDALAQVLPWAEQVEQAAQGLRLAVDGLEGAAEGTVRLALLPAVAAWFVAPAIPALRARHPGLTLELAPAAATLDLVRRESDLALRAVQPTTGDLVAMRVATTPLVLAASPDLIARLKPSALGDLPYVALGPDMDELPENVILRRVVPGARVVLRSTDLVSLLHAARAGVGAIVVAGPLAARVGGLVRVPVPTPPLPSGPLWLVAPRALRRVPRIAAVWDWIVDEMAAARADGRMSLPESAAR